MDGTKRNNITIVDRATVKELGDRFEIEWQLSANPGLEWAEIFQLAEVPVRNGAPDWVEGGSPDVMGAVIRWFVPGDKVEDADAEVQYRLSVANERVGLEPGKIERFFHDEDGYRKWLRSIAAGYVLNCDRQPKASYLMLHRASCRTISGKPPRGSTWTTPYMKVCAKSVRELDDWAKANTGQLPDRCSVCQP
jgi:hypothetical protein